MNDQLRVTQLRCEYLTNPLGLGMPAPRLSWVLESNRRGERQTAYQIIAASSPEKLAGDEADVWDSGKVASAETCHVRYAGPTLASRQRVWWKVRVWDGDGEPSAWSEPAWWEMGLLARQEWIGRWIGGPLKGGPRSSCPAPFLRKGFRLEQEVRFARLYVTALGLYEVEINGQRVGRDIFTPGWTDYKKRVQYQVYDVTDLLQAGENAIGAILGDGWYCGNVAAFGRQLYGDRPRLLAQLEITLADGRTMTVATDDSWKVAYGPILEADLIMGEAYDARLEFPGWSTAGFDDGSWWPVQVFPDPGIELSPMRGQPVRRQEELKPIAAPRQFRGWVSSKWVFDLGQNMVGWVRIKVRGPAGATVTLRFGEMLNPDGTLYTANLRTARATDYYTLKGDGEEVWEPRFTFHGFRYVELSGLPGEVTADAVTGVVVHSDAPLSGAFECSDPLVNQLQHNIQWGQKGNYLEVPTDCPQRDERLGWTGDAQVFIRTGIFNRDVAAFFTKWQRDLADAQSPEGAFPMVAPSVLGPDGGPAWADAGIICPWTVYQCYGDTALLAEHYDSLARFIAYLEQTSQDYIRSYEGYPGFPGFGDWLALDGSGLTDGGTRKDLIGTAFFAYSARLMGRIAAALGKAAVAERYAQLFENVRAAFQKRFVTPAGLVAGATQTSYVLALHFDLLPPALRPVAVDQIVRDIRRRNNHLSTGFVGASYLPFVLSEGGRLDVAYELLFQKTWPSWLYAVTQGATTIWERWDGWTHDKGFQDVGMNSFNHYAYGAIGEWLYRVVAGLDLDPDRPGYAHIVIRPHPGGGLTHARAAYDSIRGKIVSGWRVADGLLTLEVTVPANTTATVYMPTADPGQVTEEGGMAGVTFVRPEEGRAVYEVGAGSYVFRAPWNE
ncbi:MAG: family 78 glycoside hydrolase catalytic domain [Anaerolineae bacterium]